MNLARVSTILALSSALCLLGVVLSTVSGCGSKRTATTSGQANSANEAEKSYDGTDATALDTIGNRSWYDPASGEYRPPKPLQDADHPLRRTGTVAGPSAPKPVKGGGGFAGWTWPSGEVIGYIILITLATGLVGVAILLAVTSLRSWLPGRSLNPLQHSAIAIDPSRVADLPFEAQSEMQDPLAYARHLISQGKLDEAIIFIYGYMLLALDRAGKIILHRGKTNRMYLHELAGDAHLRRILMPAMLAFEDVFFGRHSIEPERFRKIWDELDHFHRALAPSIASAAPLEESVAP